MIDRTCLVCGKQFRVPPSARGKYCSPECYHTTLAGKAFTPKTSQAVNCAACGKPFELPPAKIKRSKKLYCSQVCMGQGQSATLPLSDSEIADRYLLRRQAMQTIATACGVSPWVIRRHLQEMGIALRSRAQWGQQSWDQSGPARYASASETGKRNIVHAITKGSPIAGALALQKKRGPSMIERLFMAGLEERHESYLFQHGIDDKYLCDFYLPSRNLLVECDGSYWHDTPKAKARDAIKDAYLVERGYQVVRFTDKQIESDLTSCLDKALGYSASA